MIFRELGLRGAFVVELEAIEDTRGYFGRTWCSRTFAEHGLEAQLVQCSVSFNRVRGTLRGMHFQAPPHAEAKLVTCVRGAIYDVIVDLVAGSPTYGRWEAIELREGRWSSVYIPRGFAHGFQTLVDESVVYYQMTEFFAPEAARGIRWDDPALGIPWPVPGPTVSEKDQALPFL